MSVVSCVGVNGGVIVGRLEAAVTDAVGAGRAGVGRCAGPLAGQAGRVQGSDPVEAVWSPMTLALTLSLN